MSSTNLAYAVIGVKVPIETFFSTGTRFMVCNDHGISESVGAYCSHCGDKLEEQWEKIPTPDMENASKFYSLSPLTLWELMRAKKDDDDDGKAPLGLWTVKYDREYGNDDADDESLVGLHLMDTPFTGDEEYPVADRSTEFVYETGRIAADHLRNFGITAKPRLFIFSYT